MRRIFQVKSKNLFFGIPSGVGPTGVPAKGFRYVGKRVHIYFDFRTTNPASIRTRLEPNRGLRCIIFFASFVPKGMLQSVARN
jgi:hypothetical protein